jgi:transposase
MEEMVKLLSEDLQYIGHEVSDAGIELYVESTNEQAQCPYCGANSTKVHSTYLRKLQDLPMQGKKVVIYLTNRKYFCVNEQCGQRTFAERFTFFEASATKTKRLLEEIKRIATTQSALSASKYLRQSVAQVGKSTICNLLKKTEQNN